MILLDTGYLVAVLRPRDELHARAAAWSRFLREPFLITEYVLWETINHFSEPITGFLTKLAEIPLMKLWLRRALCTRPGWISIAGMPTSHGH